MTSRKRKSDFLYTYNEDGSKTLKPLNVAGFDPPTSISKKKSSEKKRPLAFDLKPLPPNLWPPGSPKQPKWRKLDKSAKRELFTESGSKVKRKQNEAQTANKTNQKGFQFKSPKLIITNVSNENNIKTPSLKSTNSILNMETPSSKEFLKWEKEFEKEYEDSEVKPESPMSNVCNLLTNTALNSSQKQKPPKTIIDKIRNIIKKDNEEFNKFKEFHEHNMRTIMKLLEGSFDNSYEDNDKENVSEAATRKSLRLAARNSDSEQEPKMNGVAVLVSPVISKQPDLRRTMLTRNLLSNQKQSPLSGNLTNKNKNEIRYVGLNTPCRAALKNQVAMLSDNELND